MWRKIIDWYEDLEREHLAVLDRPELAAQVALTGRSLQELATAMTKLPQLMINVKGVDKARAGTDEGVAAAVAAATEELGETGRVLLRPSGTEALVRVMVEAADMETAERICTGLAAVVKERLAVSTELAV